MPPKIYGGGRHGWHRPARCDCDKIPYRGEEEALAAAAKRGEDAGIPLTVYKCPGSSSWHLTGRGFRPEALKTRPRIMAWHLTVRRVISLDGLYGELGLDPVPGEDRSQKAKAFRVLAAFADLGLVRLDDPRRSYVTAADDAGLRRVMQAGLQEYADSRGLSVTRPARGERSEGDGPPLA